MTTLIRNAYRECTPRVFCDDDYQLPFWWSEDIQTAIQDVQHKRRKFQRITNDPMQREEKLREYKEAKNAVKTNIKIAKRRAWRDLCDKLEDDIFGQGYQITRAQLQKLPPKIEMSSTERLNIFKELFIHQRPNRLEPKNEATVIRDCDIFVEQEVIEACIKIKPKKAPGPDNIPSVIAKTVIQTNIPFFLRFYNTFLLCQNFPQEWKKTKLTLIEKPKKSPEDPTKYRPICLIDEIGKVYERLINERLLTELQEKRNGFHPNQYGFRKGLSTTHALKTIQNLVVQHKGKHCVIILLDVKNAFNTASWAVIMEELNRAEISAYLKNILHSYMTSRKIIVDRNSEQDVFGGVPQGSVLGPTLWNLQYDDVMRLPLPDDTEVLCYADDLTVFVASQTPGGMVNKANYILNHISEWMEERDLQIAPEKTEAILLSFKRKTEDISFLVQGQEMKPLKSVKYLGFHLDRRLNMTSHIKEACLKAEKSIKSLKCLLPNIGGPSSTKRRVLAMVCQSIVLYGAPAWSSKASLEINKRRLNTTQRNIALRVCSAYCTVSARSANVIAGLIPLHLLAEERKRTFETLQATEIDKKIQRERTLEAWQEEWEAGPENWTKRLIPDIRPWFKRKWGKTSYQLTQFLTGHGTFGTYTYKIQKRDNEECIYCGAAVDGPEHTVFECPQWNRKRQTLYLEIGEILSTNNIINKMLEDEQTWNKINDFICHIIGTKEKKERELQ